MPFRWRIVFFFFSFKYNVRGCLWKTRRLMFQRRFHHHCLHSIGRDTICAEFGNLAGGTEGISGVELDWKAKVDSWPRATREYEADVGIFRIPGERDLYVDGVLSLANPSNTRAARTRRDVSLSFGLSGRTHSIQSSTATPGVGSSPLTFEP